MKYFFGSALLMLAALSAQGQTTQGTTLLGGNLGFNKSSAEASGQVAGVPQPRLESKQRTGQMSLSGGYFIRDNWAVGLGVSLSSTRAEQPYHAYTSSGALTIFESVSLRKSVGAAPFVRYYYMLGEKAGFYGQLSAGYSHERITTDNTNPNSYTYHTKSDIGYVNLTPAFVYFPTKKVGLEARLGYVGYDHSTNRTENATGLEAIKTTSSNFTATFGISSFSLGASLYLGR